MVQILARGAPTARPLQAPPLQAPPLDTMTSRHTNTCTHTHTHAHTHTHTHTHTHAHTRTHTHTHVQTCKHIHILTKSLCIQKVMRHCSCRGCSLLGRTPCLSGFLIFNFENTHIFLRIVSSCGQDSAFDRSVSFILILISSLAHSLSLSHSHTYAHARSVCLCPSRLLSYFFSPVYIPLSTHSSLPSHTPYTKYTSRGGGYI